MEKIKIFYSYSTADEAYQKEIEKSLAMLKRYDEIESWNFRELIAGQEWDKVIKRELEEADIILLLISRDFLASSYCYDIEVKRAIELHEAGNTIVIPIILRECDWLHESSPIKKLQGLPRNALPVKQWIDQDSAFNDITQQLRHSIRQARERKVSQKKNEELGEVRVVDVSDQKPTSKTYIKAFEIIAQQKSKLNFDTTKQDLETIEELKRKLYEEFFGEIDKKIKNVPALKDKFVEVLFERIYSTEKLEEITFSEIQSVRNDTKTYRWFERKVIVNSLALSLLFNAAFDHKKANLLLDFVTDFEDGVWQCALTGLVLTLIYHQNRWQRFYDLKKRLETLKEINQVQIALRAIEIILRYNFFEKSFFLPKIFEQDFFNTPMNCFLPFYKGNPVLENALSVNGSNVDPENFNEFISNLPFLDSYKYFLTLAVEEGNAEERIARREEFMPYLEPFWLSNVYSPFQNLISEFFVFTKHYPKVKSDQIFLNQMALGKTKLKGLILNRTNDLLITSYYFLDEGNINGAIEKLTELISIEPENLSALWTIAKAYQNLRKPDYKRALKYLKDYQSIKGDNINVLLEIGKILKNLDERDDEQFYYKEAEKVNPNNISLLKQFGDFYHDLEEHEKAITYFARGNELYPDDYYFELSLAYSYLNLSKHEIAFKHADLAFKKVEKEDQFVVYILYASIYSDRREYSKAIEYLETANRLSRKNPDILATLGRAYLLGDIDRNLARTLLLDSLDLKKDGVTYGNLGHLALLEGNEELAFEYYKHSIAKLKGIEEFKKRFERDIPLLEAIGITTDKLSIVLDTLVYNKQSGSNIRA